MATTLIAKIAARAKVIRKSNPKMSWQSALKKAGAELKGSGAKTTSKRRVGVVARTKKGKTVKRKIGDPVENAYKRAPLAVKKVLDDLGDKDDYKSLGIAQKKLKKLGWDMDYYLDGSITYLRPIKKTTKPKTTKRVSGSTHKDNKSHNVSIRVVSGTKRVKTVRPKIQKTNIDLEKLNGILKIQTGKYFEVESGTLKKSAFYIKSTSKATKDKPKTYNVKFWQFRSGRLSKPFDATITDAWINKRSIRPRGVVKSTEYIAFAK